MSVNEAAAQAAIGTEEAPPRPSGMVTGAGVTAGAAVIAGLLLVTREQSIGTLGALAIAVGIVALAVTAAALRQWGWARSWTGPNGLLEPMAGPMAWLAVVFAAVVVATNFVPEVIPAWSREQVFAVVIVAFAVLSVFGFGPGVSRMWPSGLRLSTLTALGTVVALLLIATYLIFLVLMRADALNGNIDATEWSRLVEIRATLEAMAFAAAGVLLGVTVQRQVVVGDLREREEQIGHLETPLTATANDLAVREARVAALRGSVATALRALTPEAPDDIERLDPQQMEAFVQRANSAAVRQARRTLIEALRAPA